MPVIRMPVIRMPVIRMPVIAMHLREAFGIGFELQRISLIVENNDCHLAAMDERCATTHSQTRSD
jgi:hypothetical protein